MEIISMILLAIVLVAQIVLFVLYFLEKRYVNHRFSAMLQYTDRRINECDSKEDVMECVDDVMDAFGEDQREIQTPERGYRRISENRQRES